jgi:hypothetical protein
MPVPKKRTISTSEAANVEPSSDQKLPDEQEFRQRMRNLAVSAMRVLIEEVMREERCRSALVPHGGKSPLSEKAIATARTHEIW